ncbi:NAD(P)/FAD-dependent oxidoreductase [Petrocella sp. FN5]|uniref:NAD(P)/FAD-dependent oxidoreductase n=1 Tax=Petrocella sp. FN5 TaxID=3032002 RepID=UPI0023DCDC44|nr:FAD-binding protein [Petrocella sp. FN5]MDF1618176.1 FAD-dependent monooxygenase [Petrocella sp. FN5]
MGYYRIEQIKMPLDHDVDDLYKLVKTIYGLEPKTEIRIIKKSVDARKKEAIKIVYTVHVVMAASTNRKLSKLTYIEEMPSYELKGPIKIPKKRPVVIGAGPAGLFAALILAEQGARPILLERGRPVDERIKDVETYFETGKLDVESNIQFGEGGAGTYSDGKINTGVKDKFYRIDKILDTFIEAGAPEEIRYVNKPHMGTDYLIQVVKNMRLRIIALGGEVHFNRKMTELVIEDGAISGVKDQFGHLIATNHVVLAIGHSARDTFLRLIIDEIPMEKKAFAIGLRIEHPQEMISKKQYGVGYDHPNLPVADYKLTYRTGQGRAVYTFCMCPGGFVVNSASENGHVVCNGMSNFKRDEVNANSALLVNVLPEDFDGDDLMAGVHFQRKWEKKAFEIAGSNYSLPVQKLDDFMNGRITAAFGSVQPNIKGQYTMTDLNQALPDFVAEALKEGIQAFGKKIKDFDRKDAVLTGVETRTSSPIRILRDEAYMSPVKGLYPCGEGAGYAGGIMSAALDGMKVAESILSMNLVP